MVKDSTKSVLTIFAIWCIVNPRKSYIQLNIIPTYSEWWRYIGPVKPRQPLEKEGANLSEINLNNKWI